MILNFNVRHIPRPWSITLPGMKMIRWTFGMNTPSDENYSRDLDLCHMTLTFYRRHPQTMTFYHARYEDEALSLCDVNVNTAVTLIFTIWPWTSIGVLLIPWPFTLPGMKMIRTVGLLLCRYIRTSYNHCTFQYPWAPLLRGDSVNSAVIYLSHHFDLSYSLRYSFVHKIINTSITLMIR